MNVIFDMDGLMFDTEKVFIKAWDYAGEKIGIGKAGYMVYKTLGMSIVASYEIWNEEFGDRYNQEELRKYTKEFLKNYYENNKVPVKQGLYVLLEYLKNANAKLAVASSSPRWEVEKHLNDAGIIDCFSAIICGDMVEKSKPAPDVYIKACEMLNENPEECIALEDSKNGLLSAYRAGCKPIMVPDLWQPDEEILQIIKGKYSDLEQVKKAYEKYKGKIEFVGIDCNDTEDKWKKAVAEHQLPWINVRNIGEPDVAVMYGVSGYPTKYVIDPEGKIAKQVVGENPEFYMYLDALMK